jgi:hypothetical protein
MSRTLHCKLTGIDALTKQVFDKPVLEKPMIGNKLAKIALKKAANDLMQPRQQSIDFLLKAARSL